MHVCISFVACMVLTTLVITFFCCPGTSRGRNCCLNCMYRHFHCCLCYRKNAHSPPQTRTNVMGLEHLHSDIQDEGNDIFSAYCFLYLKMPQSDGLEIIYLKTLYLYYYNQHLMLMHQLVNIQPRQRALAPNPAQEEIRVQRDQEQPDPPREIRNNPPQP